MTHGRVAAGVASAGQDVSSISSYSPPQSRAGGAGCVPRRPTVALAHDYVTQRGGAERVVLSLLEAFPRAALHTSLFNSEATFPAFAGRDVKTLQINGISALRQNHRLALPLLAPAFSSLHVDADVVVCSSSGWAHGLRTSGRKVVYGHAPARWLYQRDLYLGQGSSSAARFALATLGPGLRRWDRWAMRGAHRYLVNSTATRDMFRSLYGVDAEVLPPPHTLDPGGRQEAVSGLEPGFLVSVSRLLPYKNVDVVLSALARMPQERLVVVGAGPDTDRLRAMSSPNVVFLGSVTDEQLRWLYANCSGLVSASHEDFGITPLEVAAFGRPVAVLRSGGFLDTVVEGETGVWIERPDPDAVVSAIERLRSEAWRAATIRRHADKYTEARFVERMRSVVAEEAASAR